MVDDTHDRPTRAELNLATDHARALLQREGAGMQSELARATQLLHEGMERLGSFFATVNDAMKDQQALVREVMLANADGDAAAASLEALDTLVRETRLQADSAVVALQLDDMLGQLLAHTQRRLTRVVSLAESVSALAQVADGSESAEVIDAASHVHEHVHRIRTHPDTMVVPATELAVGEVELF